MHILSLSTVFPNALEPDLGLFVERRLQHLSEHADVTVVAPVIPFEYNKRRWNGSVQIPVNRRSGRLNILQPRWVYVPGSGSVTAFALFAQLLRPILRLKEQTAFDVIDAHFGYPEGIAAALIATVLKVPFTITMRGSEILHNRYPLRAGLMRWAFRRADLIITMSEQLRNLAVSHGASPERVKVIPNGVDATLFYPRDRRQVREKNGIPADWPVILSAGHLIELKGYQYIIRAVRMLYDQGLRPHLLIAGKNKNRGVVDYEPALRRLVSELDIASQVHFLGGVEPERLAELMSAADVFCLGSTREGWPNVVHEALACGAPVVATQVGAVSALITSERQGFVVPPADPQALAQALKRIFMNDWDRQEIARNAHQRSWSNVATEVLSELTEVLRKSSTDDSVPQEGAIPRQFF